MQHLTVRDLKTLMQRAESVMDADQTREEHIDLIRECHDVVVLIDRIVGASHMGCALDEVILRETTDDVAGFGALAAALGLPDAERTMKTLVELINQQDATRRASYEYPGSVHMAAKVECKAQPLFWVIGNVNGPWGADLHYLDGVQESTIEVEGSAAWTPAMLFPVLMTKIMQAEKDASEVTVSIVGLEHDDDVVDDDNVLDEMCQECGQFACICKEVGEGE